MLKGIRYVAPVGDSSGYAKASRENIMALYKLGVPLTVQSMSFEEARPDLGETGKIINSLINKNIEYDTVVLHSTPEFWGKYREDGKLNVGYTVWETTKLHDSWPKMINESVDACMVACDWNVEVFRDSGVTVPLFNVPHVISVEEFEKASEKIHKYKINGIDDDTFVFYNINQFTERKNIVSLVKAYWSAFTKNENVALVLKTYRNNHSDQEKSIMREMMARLKAMCAMPEGANFPPIYLILDVLSEDEIKALHMLGDCYVTLDRGEGFGISSATAGAVGNPLIATGFGGVNEYANKDNSYLVDYTEVAVSNMPWCVLPGNKIVSNNDRKAVELINLDDEILSQGGVYRRPMRIWSKEVIKESCFKIKAQGESSFSVTKDHIIPVYRNGGRVEIPASNIKVGDYLIKEIDTTWSKCSTLPVSDFVSVANYDLKDGFYYSKSGPSCNSRVIRSTLTMDNSFGRLLGYYLSEGNASIEKRSVFFNFGYKEEASYTCEMLLKEVFGTTLKISRLDREERSESRITIYSSLIVKLFKKLCGSYSYGKHFDRKFLSMFNREFALGIVGGLFEGDGHAQLDGRNGFYLSLVNERLLSSIKELLSKFGVSASLRKSRGACAKAIKKSVVSMRDVWSLEITGADKITLGDLLCYNTDKWKIRYSRRKYVNNKDCFLLPIQKVEEFEYSGKVYDIDMGIEHPYYNINGFLIHNCPWYTVNQYWAQPNEKQAAEVMNHIYNNKEEAKLMGAKLKSDIKNNFSYEVIGNKIINAIRSSR